MDVFLTGVVLIGLFIAAMTLIFRGLFAYVDGHMDGTNGNWTDDTRTGLYRQVYLRGRMRGVVVEHRRLVRKKRNAERRKQEGLS